MDTAETNSATETVAQAANGSNSQPPREPFAPLTPRERTADALASYDFALAEMRHRGEPP